MIAAPKHRFTAWLRTALFPVVLAFGAASAASATEIYTWVDAQGVTHFSETPPQEIQLQVQVLTLEPLAVVAPSPRTNEIIDVANQLEASRLAREQAALDRQIALEQLDLEQQWLEQQAARVPAPPLYTYPVSIRPRGKHHHRPPFHKRPDCAPHCNDKPLRADAPFHRTGRHGTTHLRPYKSLPDGP